MRGAVTAPQVRHGLPTARHVTFTDFAAAKAHVEAIDYPVVVKCSGLAGGTVC